MSIALISFGSIAAPIARTLADCSVPLARVTGSTSPGRTMADR